MEEKKSEQVSDLKDEQLEDVSGGSRVLLSCSQVTAIDAEDGMRAAVLKSAACLASAADAGVDAAVLSAAADDDKELDSYLPHLPHTW